jgi:hypothetical protein
MIKKGQITNCPYTIKKPNKTQRRFRDEGSLLRIGTVSAGYYHHITNVSYIRRKHEGNTVQIRCNNEAETGIPPDVWLLCRLLIPEK